VTRRTGPVDHGRVAVYGGLGTAVAKELIRVWACQWCGVPKLAAVTPNRREGGGNSHRGLHETVECRRWVGDNDEWVAVEWAWRWGIRGLKEWNWRWCVMVCENDLKYGWSWDRENNGNTGDARIFRQVQASQRIINLRPVFLYCSWQLVLWWGGPLGVPLPLVLYPRGARSQGR
jgi:hypothetical protein